MGRGRCAGSRRRSRWRCQPRPPGVSCPSPASPRGPLGQPGPRDVPGPWGVGSLLSGGPTGRPVPRGWTPGGLRRRLLRPRRPPPRPSPGPPRGRLPERGGERGGTGRATGTSVPLPGGCGRPPPFLPRGSSMHRVPRQVFQHRPAFVDFVRTQGAGYTVGLLCETGETSLKRRTGR